MIIRCAFLVLMSFCFPNRIAAEECKILWWNLFLEPATVHFEKTSELSAVLTLIDTSAGKEIDIDLSNTVFSTDEGNEMEMLYGSRTLVLGGITNHVKLTLQAKSKSWLIDFNTTQSLTSEENKVYNYDTNTSGYLFCEELRPW